MRTFHLFSPMRCRRRTLLSLFFFFIFVFNIIDRVGLRRIFKLFFDIKSWNDAKQILKWSQKQKKNRNFVDDKTNKTANARMNSLT